jgi:hypothetical protein
VGLEALMPNLHAALAIQVYYKTISEPLLRGTGNISFTNAKTISSHES